MRLLWVPFPEQGPPRMNRTFGLFENVENNFFICHILF